MTLSIRLTAITRAALIAWGAATSAMSPGCSSSDSSRAAPEVVEGAGDRVAIRRLHEADMRAVLAGDTAALMALWTDDIVSLAPDGPVRRGRAANAAYLRATMAAARDVQPLEYRLELDSVELLGSYALEWGSYHGRSRVSSDGRVVSASGKLMRFLRKEADGTWRVARTMFTIDAIPERS